MIKVIAILTMVLDHIGAVFFPSNHWLHIIGRMAFPLFAWGIAIGYKRSRNPKGYAVRLFILAIISQIPHFLLFESKYLNVCFTLLGGLLILIIIHSNKNQFIKITFTITICILVHLTRVEYGIYGLLSILIFYYYQKAWISISFHCISIMIGISLYHYSYIQFFAILSTFIVIYLKKYDIKFNKFFYYGFYPVHIILLLVIRNLTER